MRSPARPDVTMLIPGFVGSGGIRTLIEWTNRLAGEGRRVCVISPFDGSMRRLVDPGVPILLPPRPVQNAARVAQVATAMTIGSLPTMYAHNWLARRRKSLGHRVVAGFLPWYGDLTSRQEVLGYAQHWEPIWVNGRRAKQRAATAVISAEHLVVNSSWLRSHLPVERQPTADLVFPGVDLDVFRADGMPRRSGGSLRIAALGRADVRWKGTEDLLQALRLRTGSRPVDLHLFGTKDRGQADAPWGRTVKTGYLNPSELSQLYRDVDLVLNPSWHESFPLPPLEAMACGAAVITTTIGTEDYAVDGVNSLTVSPKDAGALAEAIDRYEDLGSIERENLRTAGLATASRFTWENGFRQFRAALERVAPAA